MKIFGILLALFCITSCQSSHQFEWLSGSWQGTNDEGGNQTYEYWEKDRDEMKGIGCTIAAGDTVFPSRRVSVSGPLGLVLNIKDSL